MAKEPDGWTAKKTDLEEDDGAAVEDRDDVQAGAGHQNHLKDVQRAPQVTAQSQAPYFEQRLQSKQHRQHHLTQTGKVH